MKSFILCAIVLLALGYVQESKAASGVVYCYHGTWSTYRPDSGKFGVENIDPSLCTHLAYAFFGLSDDGTIKSLDPYLDYEEDWGRGNVKKFNALKQQNPNLKTFLGLGGWNEGSDKYSTVAADPGKRQTFIASAIDLISRLGFDGLDFDWEYPAQRGGRPEDKSNYNTFVREIKAEFDKHGYQLTAAVAATENSAGQSYDIAEMSKYLDLINVMTYDFHGAWDTQTGENSPLYAGPSDVTKDEQQMNIDSSINYWLSQGAPADKLVMGVPFYGRTFSLADPNNNGVGAPIWGGGTAGPYTREAGILGYNEICEFFQQGGWNYNWDQTQSVPYAYKGNQWVGYDDEGSIGTKVQYALNRNLAGVMVWSVETDDFNGKCGRRWPLLTKVNEVMGKR